MYNFIKHMYGMLVVSLPMLFLPRAYFITVIYILYRTSNSFDFHFLCFGDNFVNLYVFIMSLS